MLTNHCRAAVLGALAIAAGCAFAAAPPATNFQPGTYASSGMSMTFLDPGRFRVSEGGAVKVEGKYSIDADQLHLTDERGPWACAGEMKTGTYHWQADHGTLTFSKAEDACKERVESLTTHPWKKQE